MKDKDMSKAGLMPVFPQRIRSYLTLNLSLAVVIAVVLAVRAELTTGRFFVMDFLLFAFYSLVLSSLFFGPFGVIEVYLYRRKKGIWYEWKNRTKHGRYDRVINLAERSYWKSEAFRARLAQGNPARPEDLISRTRLFETGDRVESVSRATLLMNVADKLERSGKRAAAERCYLQIAERFADSPQATEVARRISAATSPVTSRNHAHFLPNGRPD